MILRRLTKHIREQNWFAVWLDFLIVVVGVFIGLQVSNWNDGVRLHALERSYLARLSDDLRYNVVELERANQLAIRSSNALKGFIKSIEDPSTTDADLVQATTDYLSEGAFLAKFNPTKSTFEDLKSTGNLDVIRDSNIRNALVNLYAFYELTAISFDVNMDWVLPADSVLYLEFDAFNFDKRTAVLFADQPVEIEAQKIRNNAARLKRHAALHYWLKDRAIELYDVALAETQAVLALLESEH